MSSLTNRLGLTLPSDPEPQDIDTLDANFTKLDATVGVLLVNDGVTPPNSQLFDGAIVKEKTSGKVWVAQKNVGTGNYDQSVIIQGGGWLPISLTPTIWINPGVSNPAQYRCMDGRVELHGTIQCTSILVAGNNSNINNADGAIAATINPLLVSNYTYNYALPYIGGGAMKMGFLRVITNGQLVFVPSSADGNDIMTLDGISWKDYRYS